MEQNSQSNKVIYWVAGIIVVVLLALLFSRWMQVLDEPAGLSDETGTEYFVSENGTTTLGAASLPSNWPSEIPVFNGSKLQYSGVANKDGSGKEGAAIVFESSAKASEIAAFYREKLTANGWTMAAEMSTGGTLTLGATKNKMTFGMYISPGKDGVESLVSIGVEGL